MKKTKLLTALTALCCTAAMALNASADSTQYNTEFDLDTISERYEYDYTANEAGSLVCRSISCHKGFVIIAGETELSEDVLQSIPNYSSHKTIVWDEDDAAFYDGLASFELGTILYYVTVSDWDSLVNNARQFALDNETVEDIVFIQEISDGPRGVYEHLKITFADGITPTEEQFPELTDFSMSSDGTTWTALPGGAYADEFAAIYESGDTYAEYAWLYDFAAMLHEKYDDTLITSAELMTNAKFVEYLQYKSTSIWSAFGNLNGDDTVDASDAADILTFASKAGSGDAEAVISQSASDLTMDGTVNALDAAVLLQYAAYAGTNEGAALQNYLMNK